MPPDRIVSTETHLIAFDASEGIRALQAFNSQITVVADSIKAQAAAIATSLQSITTAAQQMQIAVSTSAAQAALSTPLSGFTTNPRDPSSMGPFFNPSGQPVVASPYSSVGDMQRAWQAQTLAGRGGTFEQDPMYLQWLQSQFGGMPPGMAFARGPSPIGPITSLYDPTGYNADTLRRFHAESQLSSTPMGDYLGIQRESSSLRQMRQGTLFDTSLYSGGAYTGQERAQLAELMMGMERDAPRFGGRPQVYDRESLLYNRPQFRPSDIWPPPKGIGRQIDEEAYISGLDSSKVPTDPTAKAAAGGGMWDIGKQAERIAGYYLIWQAFQAGSDIVSSFADNMIQLNDQMVNFQVVTGKGADEARRYMDVAQEIGRTVGILGTQILPEVSLVQRAGLPQQLPTYTSQIQRAYGVEGTSAMDEYIQLMRAFPQNNPQQFGDMFAKMMQQSAFVNPAQAWSLFGGGAPIAQQYGMGLESYTNVIAALGRSNPAEQPATLERFLRRLIDIYEKPDTRGKVEEAIGGPVTYREGGQEQRVPLDEILRLLSTATEAQQRTVGESLTSPLGAPWTQFLTQMLRAMRESEAQPITVTGAAGTLSKATETAMGSSAAAIGRVQTAWQDLALSVGDAAGVVDFINQLADGIEGLSDSIKKGEGPIAEFFSMLSGETGRQAWAKRYAESGTLPHSATPEEQDEIRRRGNRLLGRPNMPMIVSGYDDRYPDFLAPSLTGGELTRAMPNLPNRAQQGRPENQIVVPQGISPEALIAEMNRIEQERQKTVAGTGELAGFQYQQATEALKVNIMAVNESGQGLIVFKGATDVATQAVQNLSAALPQITLMAGPENRLLNTGDIQTYQGYLDLARQRLNAAGNPQGARSTTNVFEERTGAYVGAYQGTAQEDILAGAMERQARRENAAALDAHTRSVQKSASAFEGFLSSKVFSPSAVTGAQLGAGRQGEYESIFGLAPDEQMRRLRATVNALNEGRGRDKLEPYMNDIMGDPRYQQLFPGGLLQPGGRAVKPGDKEYDLRMARLGQVEEGYYSGQFPWMVNMQGVANQYQQFVGQQEGRKNLTNQIVNELPGMLPKGTDLSYIKAFAESQKESPIQNWLKGGMTDADLAKDFGKTGQEIIKSMNKEAEDYMMANPMPKKVGDIWYDQALKQENLTSTTSAGMLLGNAFWDGMLQSLRTKDLINDVAELVITKLNAYAKEK